MSRPRARVFLVGGGPGDVGLLTLRGAEVLQRADTVVYDRLIPPEMLALARADARRIYVGKTPGGPGTTQEQINELLVAEAREGRLVVRLKGGDPFVFGRGGEEALALREAGVDFEIVPGVTAGIAGPAYAGIPVTHRGLASAVCLVTGHEDPSKTESDLDYAALARIGTVVFYMGVGRLRDLADRLIASGRSADTPAAIVERATTSRQRTVVASLDGLADAAERQAIKAPALVVVGPVASLAEHLAWNERRPLFGRTVVVTRTRSQAGELSRRLRDLGARVIELPTIEIEPANDEALLAALSRLQCYGWLVLTSPNGVDRLADGLRAARGDIRRLAGVKVAAIGPGTAERMATIGLRADLVPPKAIAESLAEALLAAGVGPKSRVLLLRADGARDVLPQMLRDAGADVDEVAVYRSVVPRTVDGEAMAAVSSGEADLVTLTSSSTAEHFVALVRDRLGSDGFEQVRRTTAFAAIGPITAAAARTLGLPVAVEGDVHTMDGLVEAVCRWAAAGRER